MAEYYNARIWPTKPISEAGYRTDYNYARDYHHCNKDETVARLRQKHVRLHQQLGTFLKNFIPKSMIAIGDQILQSTSATNTDALLHVAIKLLALDISSPVANLDNRLEGERTNAWKTEVYWKIFSHVIEDQRYPLNFKYNSTIARLCNRELVNAVESTISESETIMKTPEMLSNRWIKWTVHRNGVIETRNCPLLRENIRLQKKVEFLSLTLELCAHTTPLPPFGPQ